MMLLSMEKTKKIDGLPLRERIERGSMPVTECGCWIWLKSGSRLGYGMLTLRGKSVSAHRASWEAFRGNIPDGLSVMHSCDIPSCVNPDHLSLGTILENAREKMRKGRRYHTWKLASATLQSKKRMRVGLSWKERIERSVFPVTESGCWIWMGTTRLGYGRIEDFSAGRANSKVLSAHRVSYEAFVGPIPPKMLVLHRCDIPSCVNPDHLYVGNYSDNMIDRELKQRANRRKGPRAKYVEGCQ